MSFCFLTDYTIDNDTMCQTHTHQYPWGAPDANTETFEDLYAYSPLVAEWYATISNLPFFLVGFGLIDYVADSQYHTNLCILLIVCGIASTLLHATKRWFFLWADRGAIIATGVYAFWWGQYSLFTYTAPFAIQLWAVALLFHFAGMFVARYGIARNMHLHSIWHVLAAVASGATIISHYRMTLYLRGMSH